MHPSKICGAGDQHHHRYDQRQRPGHGVVYRVSGGTSSNLAAVVLRRVGSNRCLDDTSSSNINGTQMQIWGCNGGRNQKWSRG
jgi:hypothetical protein